MLWLKHIYAWLVYRIGDIHTTSRCPWVSWQVPHHLVDYDEILAALPLIRYGDIGLHRDRGYLSNAFIPGFMKHAWIHVWDGVDRPQIVEAISDGVIKRSAIAPMYSDYAIILSPHGITDAERGGACLKAERVVGTGYDPFFEFDIEEELQFYTGGDRDGAARDVEERNRNAYRYTFSCTEVVGYAWWHKREELRITRKKRLGKQVILADDFLNPSWHIKWASQSVTVDAARSLGLHEQGLAMLEDYLGR